MIELRVSQPYTRVLTKQEALCLEDWQYPNWDGESPLCKSINEYRVEFKLKNIPSIFSIDITPLFVCDKGSVPSIVPDSIADDEGWFGQFILYVLHDGGYRTGLYTRKFWDDTCFKKGFKLVDVGFWERNIVHKSVRLFGAGAFKNSEYSQQMNQVEAFRVHETDKWSLNEHDNNVLVWK